MTHVVLTISGSDPSGCAGMQADLKTFQQHGVFGTSVLSLLTVQNTLGVDAIQLLDVDFVLQQLQAVMNDLPPKAAKTGALGGPEIIRAIAARAEHWEFPLVVDPVMISKHGAPLIDESAVDAVVHYLLPVAYLLTPNRYEAARMTGMPTRTVSDLIRAAEAIGQKGARRVLVKGGGGTRSEATDVLWCDGEVHLFDAVRWATPHTHGSGCVYSAAITARLARGEDVVTAVTHAKSFVSEAIRTAPGIGHGQGPLNLQVSPLRAD